MSITEKLDKKISDLKQYLSEADEEIADFEESIKALQVDKIRANDVLSVLLEIKEDGDGKKQPDKETKKVSCKTKTSKKSDPKAKQNVVPDEADDDDEIDSNLDKIESQGQLRLHDSVEAVLRSRIGMFMTTAGITMQMCGNCENTSLRRKVSAVLKTANELETMNGLEFKKENHREMYRIAS